MRIAPALALSLTVLPILLAAGPPAAAHHMPSTNTFVSGSNQPPLLNGAVVCLVGRPGIGGACLTVPRPEGQEDQNVDVWITATDFVLGAAAFRWEGYKDTGALCGRAGDAPIGAVFKTLEPACTHVRVFPRVGYAAGTATVALAS